MSVVRIVVDSRVRVRRDELPDGVEDELRVEFTHQNPEHDKLVKLGFKAWKEPKMISTWRLEAAELEMPRGGLERVREILRRNRLDWEVVDERSEGDPAMAGRIPSHRVVLYDFQEKLVEAAFARENCLLRSGTGSGKTCAAIGLIARAQLPALVVVWNGALLRQWLARLESELGLGRGEVGIVQGARRVLRPVTLAMQQTLWRMRGSEWDWLDRSFGVVIADEVQRAAARTYLDVFDRLSARYRVGISASERRKDRKEFLTYDVFGRVALDVPEAELVRKRIVHDVEVRVVPTGYFDRAYAESLDRFSDAVADGGEVEAPDFRALLDRMVVDEGRNEIAMGLARDEVGRGNAVVAFSHRREHCRRLCSMAAAFSIRSGLLLGSDEDAAEFERAAAELRSGELKFAAGTIQAMGQGIDLPAVSRGIVATPVAGNKYLWGQVRGRMCRRAEGKLDAVVYYLLDVETVGFRHLANLCAWNARVLLLERGEWVDARGWLHEERERKKEERDAEEE